MTEPSIRSLALGALERHKRVYFGPRLLRTGVPDCSCGGYWPCPDYSGAVATLKALDKADAEWFTDVVPDHGGNPSTRYRLVFDPDPYARGVARGEGNND